MSVDVLYLAYNRLDFTRVSFAALLANTDWNLVDRLVVYDDGSTDGTREWLRDAIEIADGPALIEFRKTRLGSPVEIMVDYLATATADVFAKIDNDIAVPPGWLNKAWMVMTFHAEPDLLGLAAGWTGVTPLPPEDGIQAWRYQSASHIGGVGLMRRRAFVGFPDLWGAGRQGFTQWQHAHPQIVRGWITPDLPVVQLDLIPEEPWISLADHYVAKKWARAWPPYDEANREWWSWIEAPALESVP